MTLDDIAVLANHTVDLEKQIELVEAELKKLKEELLRYQQTIIPEALIELGLEEVKLVTGEKISYEKKYYITVPTEDLNKRRQCFEWFKTNGAASLIKTEITMKFEANELGQVELLSAENALRENEFEFSKSETIHPQTLKAFAKEYCERGNTFPESIFGVFITNVAKLEKPKNKNPKP